MNGPAIIQLWTSLSVGMWLYGLMSTDIDWSHKKWYLTELFMIIPCCNLYLKIFIFVVTAEWCDIFHERTSLLISWRNDWHVMYFQPMKMPKISLIWYSIVIHFKNFFFYQVKFAFWLKTNQTFHHEILTGGGYYYDILFKEAEWSTYLTIRSPLNF